MIQIILDLSEALNEPCDICGWLDDSGGVELVGEQGASQVLCHQCVVDLVRKSLPNSRFETYDLPSALEPVALAS